MGEPRGVQEAGACQREISLLIQREIDGAVGQEVRQMAEGGEELIVARGLHFHDPSAKGGPQLPRAVARIRARAGEGREHHGPAREQLLPGGAGA